MSAPEHQRRLTEDIAQHGVKEPIHLGHYNWQGYPKAEGFTVYEGHHRYFGARDAGLQRVPVEWDD